MRTRESHLESPGEARGEGAGENIPEAGVGELQCAAVCPKGDAGCVVYHPKGSESPCLLSWAAVRIESMGSFLPSIAGHSPEIIQKALCANMICFLYQATECDLRVQMF